MSDNQLILLCLIEVMEMTSMSKTTIYVLPGFPKPVKIHGVGAKSQSGSRWVKAEIENWVESLIKLRDAGL